MKQKYYFFLTILLLSNFSMQSENCLKLAFGSCFKDHGFESGQIFDEISKNNPDAFIWLGDIAYLDMPQMSSDFMKWYNEKDQIKRLRIKWESSVNDHYYLNFKNKIGKENIYSIWDDHDYGTNDGDKNWHMKDIFKKLFLEYMEEPENSPRWKRNGLYESYRFSKDIQLILLDNRYNQMPIEEAKNADFQDSFGEEQWEWFEQQIFNSDAKIIIIGSGVQFVDTYKSVILEDQRGFEHIYPDSTKRIYEILRRYKKSGVFFQSGDIHIGEINIDECSEKILGYKVIDFTSSGLSHSIQNDPIHYYAKPLQKLLWHQTLVSEHGTYWDHNFGILNICPDKKNNDYTIKMQIHGYNGLVFEKEQNYNKDMTFKDVENKSLGHKDLKPYDEYDKCIDKPRIEMVFKRLWKIIFTLDGILTVVELIIRLLCYPAFLLILYFLLRIIIKLCSLSMSLVFKKKIKQD